MSEMVERVARALCDDTLSRWRSPLGVQAEPWREFVPAALAAIEAMEEGLRSLLNGEHSSLSLSLNELNGPDYQTVEELLRDNPEDDTDWTSAEERENAIRSNSIWRLQWYPDTPVGFHALQASSLSGLFSAPLNSWKGVIIHDVPT